MIIEGIFELLFGLVVSIIGLIPDVSFPLFEYPNDAETILAYALVIFPVDVWVVIIVNIVVFISVSLVWAVIEWTYKKVPGID